MGGGPGGSGRREHSSRLPARLGFKIHVVEVFLAWHKLSLSSIIAQRYHTSHPAAHGSILDVPKICFLMLPRFIDGTA